MIPSQGWRILLTINEDCSSTMHENAIKSVVLLLLLMLASFAGGRDKLVQNDAMIYCFFYVGLGSV